MLIMPKIEVGTYGDNDQFCTKRSKNYLIESCRFFQNQGNSDGIEAFCDLFKKLKFCKENGNINFLRHKDCLSAEVK